MTEQERIKVAWEKMWLEYRQLARTDLIFLCNKVLGYQDVCHTYHNGIIKNLQQFKGGTDTLPAKIDGSHYKPFVPNHYNLFGPRDTMSMFFREGFKSTVVSVAHTIQWIINYPNIRILISTATSTLGESLIGEIERHFRTNEVFRSLFPELCPQGNVMEWGNMQEFTIACGEKFALANDQPVHKEPTVSMLTTGSIMAGGHFDVHKYDDMVDDKNTQTPEQIAVMQRHFNQMVPLLYRCLQHKMVPEVYEKHGNSGWRDIVGTRYHFADLYGSLIEANEKSDAPMWSIYVQGALKKGRSIRDPEAEAFWPEKISIKYLKQIESQPGGYAMVNCTPAYSPILMADFTEKPISEIRAGDMVVGFAPVKNRMTIRPSRVKSVHQLIGDVNEITLSSGRRAQCTADHKWWTGRTPSAKEPGRKPYAPVKVGRRMFSVAKPISPPTPEEQRWLDWLGGMIDGEGSCHGKNTVMIAQSNAANPEVCAKLEECLKFLGFEWTHFNRKAGIYGGRVHQSANNYMLRGGRTMTRRLLVHARMGKTKRFLNSLYTRGLLTERVNGKFGEKHIVEHITPVGTMPVYALETETGNYIVWGFASSNSQYLLNPVPDSSGLVESADQIKFIPRKVLNEILPSLRLHCTIDLHGMEVGKATSDNDYTVMTICGFGRDGRPYIVEIRRGRFTPHEVIENIFSLHHKYPNCIDFKMEKDAHARVLLPFLQREKERRQKFPNVIPIQRDNRTSKQHRIRGMQAWFVNGDIRFAEDLPCKSELINEIMFFPKYKHDDILDTLADQMQNSEGEVNSDVLPRPLPENMVKTQDGSIVPARVFQRFLGFGQNGEPVFTGQEQQQDYYAMTGVL